MPAPQFYFSGGDVLATGGIVVDERDAEALMATFYDEHTAAMRAGRVDMAVTVARVMAQLSNAFFARAQWRQASTPIHRAA